MSAPPELPPDIPPEFLAEDRRRPAIIGMVSVTALSCVVVLVRLFARAYLIREMGRDDWLIILAQVVSWVVTALSIMVVHYGSGRHLAALMQTPETLVSMYKWLVAAQLVYMLCLWLCRASGLAFYARLNQMPRYKLYLRISFGFITAVLIAQMLLIALQCIPLAALWGEVDGKCMGSTVVFIATSVLTITCDSLILFLPLNIILTIKAGLARKISLGIVLCFGVFAVITSILRMVSMIVALRHPDDATWYFSVVMVWSCTEISTAIIALSLPAMKALFGTLLKSDHATASQSGSHGSRSVGTKFSLRPIVQRSRNYDGDIACPSPSDGPSGRSLSQEALCKHEYEHHSIRMADTVPVDAASSVSIRHM
ncbi:hypothetical protein VTO42DRAFT_750 [Malbranchea cinnamomea]